MAKKRRKHGHPAKRAPAAAPPRSAPESPALSRRAIAIGVAVLLLAGVAAALLAGGDDPEGQAAVNDGQRAVPWIDPNGVTPIVGSVDVNPADDSVWFSTNTGLWRVPPAGGEPERITGRVGDAAGDNEISQELVVRFRGPDKMLASGHAPPGSDLPPPSASSSPTTPARPGPRSPASAAPSRNPATAAAPGTTSSRRRPDRHGHRRPEPSPPVAACLPFRGCSSQSSVTRTPTRTPSRR